MNSDRKRQLKEAYKNSKSKMGVYQIKNVITGKSYIGITQDLRGTMNGNKFKLEVGSFKNRALQEEWQKYGSDKFEASILMELDYGEDEAKTDYTEDLIIIRELMSEVITDKIYI